MSDAQMTEGKKTSPWVYVAIGCGVLVMVFILVAAVAGFFVYRTVHRVHAEMTDPVLRAQKVKEILGARDLPEGYHPLMTFSIPFILETAMLSDREPDPDGKGKSFDQRGFIYIKTLQTHNEKKMRDYVDGKADPAEKLRGVDIEEGEEIGRGTIKRDDLTLYYTSHTGSIKVRDERVKGICTLMYIECPGDSKFRMGIWFGPDPTASGAAGTAGTAGAAAPGEAARPGAAAPGEAGAPGTSTGKGVGSGNAGESRGKYAGTPADESAIREFMVPFAPCNH